MMKKLLLPAAVLLLMFVGTMPLSAGTITSYGDIAAPGVYMGTGISNGNWTITTYTSLTNGVTIELALRAKDRQYYNLLDGADGIYEAREGQFTTSSGARSTWNYEFSVNTGNSLLTNFQFLLGVDHDPSINVNYTWVNPKTYWWDNGWKDSSGTHKSSFFGLSSSASATGFQNSENTSFGNTPGGVFGYTDGYYSFTLQALQGGEVLASTTMTVKVGNPPTPTPEPASITLILLGIATIGATSIRRKK